MRRRPESRKATTRGWLLPIILVILFFVWVLVFYNPGKASPSPATSHERPAPSFVVVARSFNSFIVKNVGSRTGTTRYGRKMVIALKNGKIRRISPDPKFTTISLAPGERTKVLPFPRVGKNNVKRYCRVVAVGTFSRGTDGMAKACRPDFGH
jgi:hypothetical protein